MYTGEEYSDSNGYTTATSNDANALYSAPSLNHTIMPTTIPGSTLSIFASSQESLLHSSPQVPSMGFHKYEQHPHPHHHHNMSSAHGQHLINDDPARMLLSSTPLYHIVDGNNSTPILQKTESYSHNIPISLTHPSSAYAITSNNHRYDIGTLEPKVRTKSSIKFIF